MVWALSEGTNTVAQGLVGNRADALVCQGLKRGWTKLCTLEATDPVNHDLQRAARAAYLRAVLEMANVSGMQWAAPAIQRDIDGLDGWLAEQAIDELDVLLVDADKTAEERLGAFRKSIGEMLAVDVRMWGGERAGELGEAFERFVRIGWGSEAKPRTFQGVMTMHFLESVKGNQPARDVLQTQLLAEIANQDRALAPVGNLLGAIEGIPDLTVEKMLGKLQELGVLRAQAAFARLDRYPASFVDRPKLRGWLEERIAEDRNACLLWGGPGTGKSTLALEAGYRAHEGGRTVVQQFCGLDRGHEAVGVELAAALPGDDARADPKLRIERALRWLRERNALVILDDIWDEQVTKLAPGPPAFTLFTSRREDAAHLPGGARCQAGGFEPEESETLIENRLPGWLATDGEALRAFARRVEHLPYALEVAVRLMEGDPRPRTQAVERVRAAALRAGELDLDGLLREAVEALPEAARRLLHAVALCAPEGVWLPFAGEVAGLDEAGWWQAAAAARGASLLVEVDREESVYRVHAELRRVFSREAEGLQGRRAEAATRLFGEWREDRTKWRDPVRVLAEAEAAVEWLAAAGGEKALTRLDRDAFELAYRSGNLAEALRLLEQGEAFYAELGDRARLARSWGNQAVILQAWGRLEEAMALLEKQEAAKAELGDRAALAASWGNQALILQAWGRLEEAMALHKKEEAAKAELGDRAGLARSWGHQAGILQAWGRLEEAMALLEKEEAAWAELGDRAGLARSWGSQAGILQAWGRLEEAMALLEKQEAAKAELGDRAGLATSWANQGVVLEKMGREEDGWEMWQRAEAVFAELGMVRERDMVRGWLGEEE